MILGASTQRPPVSVRSVLGEDRARRPRSPRPSRPWRSWVGPVLWTGSLAAIALAAWSVRTIMFPGPDAAQPPSAWQYARIEEAVATTGASSTTVTAAPTTLTAITVVPPLPTVPTTGALPLGSGSPGNGSPGVAVATGGTGRSGDDHSGATVPTAPTIAPGSTAVTFDDKGGLRPDDVSDDVNDDVSDDVDDDNSGKGSSNSGSGSGNDDDHSDNSGKGSSNSGSGSGGDDD
ncbi:MAG: hypothetical protein R2755_07655 [Acidimicrobiales bacterium]